MSKITNDGLTRSSTGRFIAVPIWQQWVSKGYSLGLLVWRWDVHAVVRRYICTARFAVHCMWPSV